MSIEAMKQALEALETLARYENPETRIHVRKPKDGGPIVTMYPHKVASDAAADLRAAIEQAEKPKYDPIELHVLHSHIAGVLFDFMGWLTSREKRLTLSSTDEAGPAVEAITEFAKMRGLSLHDAQVEHWQAILTTPPTAPRQEQYDQTSLELCEECGWRALIPGDGCLVCARQKAKPVWIPRVHLEAAQREPSMCRVEPTNRLPDFVPLYTAPPPRYRRGTYVRCMESDELCRVYTTSIDGGAWVRWPDGSITTYTAEQMGQAFSLEQAAPGKPVAYADSRIHGWPDCFVMEPDPPHTIPLYTEPREWVGLTEEEIHEFYWGMPHEVGPDEIRAIEAKLKEKNCG